MTFDLGKFTNNDIFIETGTYGGDGVREAIKVGFKEIYSIEFDRKRYENCKNLFKHNENVKIIHGDSSIETQFVIGVS